MAGSQRTIRIRFDGTVAALRKATAAGREQMQRFRRTATEANDAIASSTSKVDRQIEEVERSLKSLAREFEETGDVELFKKIRKDRSLLRQLRNIREELDDVGDEAGEAGRKIGVAFSGQLLGRVGRVLPGAIGGVFNALPPKVQGAVVIAAVALAASFATAFGAAVVAAILLAVGGGVLAAGIIAAAQDPQVKKAWGSVGDVAKDAFSGFTDAFTGPVARAAGTVKDLLKDLGPTFKDIGGDMAPLIDELVPAFADLVKNSMPGFERALKASKPLFETIADHAPEIGDAISKFFAIVAEGAPGATKFLDHLLTAVEVLLPMIGLFFMQLSLGYLTTVEVFKDIARVVYGLTIVILEAIQAVVDIAAKIPGPHQDAMKKVSNAVGGAINKVKGLKKALDDVPTAKKVNIRFTNRKLFLRHIREMRRELERLGLTARNIRVAGVTGRGGHSERAHGGPVAAGRTYLVGERGPELLTMGGASGHITPNHELGGGGDTHVSVYIDGRALDESVVRVVSERDRRLARRTRAGVARMA